MGLSLGYCPRPLSTLYTPRNFAKTCKLLKHSNFCPQDFRDEIKTLGYYYCHRFCYFYSVPRFWDAVVHKMGAPYVSWVPVSGDRQA